MSRQETLSRRVQVSENYCIEVIQFDLIIIVQVIKPKLIYEYVVDSLEEAKDFVTNFIDQYGSRGYQLTAVAALRGFLDPAACQRLLIHSDVPRTLLLTPHDEEGGTLPIPFIRIADYNSIRIVNSANGRIWDVIAGSNRDAYYPTANTTAFDAIRASITFYSSASYRVDAVNFLRESGMVSDVEYEILLSDIRPYRTLVDIMDEAGNIPTMRTYIEAQSRISMSTLTSNSSTMPAITEVSLSNDLELRINRALDDESGRLVIHPVRNKIQVLPAERRILTQLWRDYGGDVSCLPYDDTSTSCLCGVCSTRRRPNTAICLRCNNNGRIPFCPTCGSTGLVQNHYCDMCNGNSSPYPIIDLLEIESNEVKNFWSQRVAGNYRTAFQMLRMNPSLFPPLPCLVCLGRSAGNGQVCHRCNNTGVEQICDICHGTGMDMSPHDKHESHDCECGGVPNNPAAWLNSNIVNTLVNCPLCSESRIEFGLQPDHECSLCHGTGRITIATTSHLPSTNQSSICQFCHGTLEAWNLVRNVWEECRACVKQSAPNNPRASRKINL